MINNIKNTLKKSKILSAINAKIKCKQLKNKYIKIVKKYKQKKQNYTLEELLEQKGFTKEWKDSLSGKKLNIYFFGKDEFQDKSGFIQDLSKVCNLNYFIKHDGSYGRYNDEELYGKTLGKELNTINLVESLTRLININEKPDIVIFQALGKSFNIDTLKTFKEKYNLKFINICLDDRLIFESDSNNGAISLKPIVDLALVSNPEVVEWYIKEDVPALFFPMASSKEFYYPMDVKKKYDVGFIGNKYGYREELVNSLIDSGIKVEARGTGWHAGRIKLEDNNKFFNECKIILGMGTVGHCKDFYTQKLRDFDAPLSGGVYVTHNNEDLKELFVEDKEIILCNSIDEYISKIKVLLDDETKLNKIAKSAYEKSSNIHTYEKRFTKLFNNLGIKNVL